jgi:hypothetical protein
MRKILIITFIAAVMAGSCYYDNEEYLYPELNTSCDTTSVTFSATIKPLLSDHCWSCHSNSTAAAFGNNIRLENYSDVQSQSTSVLGAIRHEAPLSPMPKGGAKLSDCLIQQFSIWVNDGTPQN